jgi:hypothetical protein
MLNRNEKFVLAYRPPVKEDLSTNYQFWIDTNANPWAVYGRSIDGWERK